MKGASNDLSSYVLNLPPCQSDGQRLPHPTDCHKYYECSDPDGDGLMAVEEHDCGDWFFDPALNTCVDPERPGNEGLCPEEA